MNKFTKIAAGSVLALGLMGAGIGAANANNLPLPTPTPSASGAHTATQGTTIEVPDAKEQPGKSDPPENAKTDGSDGGHEDQNGVDVQHDGGGNEK